MKNTYPLLLLLSLVMSPIHAHADSENVFDLKKVFSSVMDLHPAVSGKRAEVSAKAYAVDSAKAGYYPSLTTQAGYQNTQVGNQDIRQGSLALRARQPLWAFGRIDGAVEYAEADLSAEEADLLRVKRDLLEQSAIAYAKVLNVYLHLEAVSDNIKSHDRFHQQIQRREKGQLASKADVQLAALRLIQARSQKKRIEGDLHLALNELRSLTQRPIEQLQPIDEGLLKMPLTTAEIESRALKQSANIRHKNRQFEAAQANTLKEQASAMPTIYLQAERKFNQLGNNDGNQFGIIIEGSLDGMGFSAFGKARAARAREEAAKESLKVSHNELIKNVRSLIYSRQIQNELIEVLQRSVEENHNILDSYLRQYRSGRKSWMEVLNIQRELTDQRLQYAQAKSDWLIYTLRLKTLLGDFDELARVSE